MFKNRVVFARMESQFIDISCFLWESRRKGNVSRRKQADVIYIYIYLFIYLVSYIYLFVCLFIRWMEVRKWNCCVAYYWLGFAKTSPSWGLCQASCKILVGKHDRRFPQRLHSPGRRSDILTLLLGLCTSQLHRRYTPWACWQICTSQADTRCKCTSPCCFRTDSRKVQLRARSLEDKCLALRIPWSTKPSEKIRPHRRCWGVIFRMALVKGYRFTWGGGAFFGQNLLFLIGRDARLQKTL